jgi:MarR family transcriptional regulator, organic hydroperoxide resistance regulator
MSAKAKKTKPSATSHDHFTYPAEESIGHQVRWTHRALQRELESQIRPFGITIGMWGFLRALWEKDGLTQRELSERVGTSEPTTVTALHAMEKRGLVKRMQNTIDRRKSNIYLTPPARALRELALPTAREVNRLAAATLTRSEIATLKRLLAKIRVNLKAVAANRSATTAKD